MILRETALIEAFNLKAAIEYVLKNQDAAKEALSDMPPRSEEELDPITLHNQVRFPPSIVSASVHTFVNPTSRTLAQVVVLCTFHS